MGPMGMVENFLTQQEVDEILVDFMTADRKSEPTNDYVFEGGTPLTEAVYNLPATLRYVPRFEEYLKKIYGDNLVFSNTFTRLYKNGSFLRIHTDREGLDVTVSLGLRRDVPWTISVSPKLTTPEWSNHVSFDKSSWLKTYSSFDLYPGDFAHCYGRRNPHWRDKLVCGEDQCNVYSFLHWTFK